MRHGIVSAQKNKKSNGITNMKRRNYSMQKDPTTL